jgi:hypothetical protein
MVAGADSIYGLDRLRHGGMGRLFTGIRALSTGCVGVLSTPTAAAVIATTQLRKGSTLSVRGAASFVAATYPRRSGAAQLGRRLCETHPVTDRCAGRTQ